MASQIAGVKARVIMMETASQVKIKATESFGAEVILKGKTYDESYALAESLQGDSVFIHPFADPLIIAGQGTTALEVFQIPSGGDFRCDGYWRRRIDIRCLLSFKALETLLSDLWSGLGWDAGSMPKFS